MTDVGKTILYILSRPQNLQNLRQLFDWQYIGQIIGGDFAKFCGLLRIYELYSCTVLIFLTDLRRQNRSDLSDRSGQKIAKNQVEPKESSDESDDDDDISEHSGSPLPKVGTF